MNRKDRYWKGRIPAHRRNTGAIFYTPGNRGNSWQVGITMSQKWGSGRNRDGETASQRRRQWTYVLLFLCALYRHLCRHNDMTTTPLFCCRSDRSLTPACSSEPTVLWPAMRVSISHDLPNCGSVVLKLVSGVVNPHAHAARTLWHAVLPCPYWE